MRLDYAMRPLRRGGLHPAALVRQVAADVLNGGLEAVRPGGGGAGGRNPYVGGGTRPCLRRALLNLVNNCVRHNPEGCAITLTAAA